MKNAMQLKAYIKNYAYKNRIAPQAVLQNYMLERLLERISISEYRNNFILKGGMLIAAMVGLDTRTTMDMDATLKNYPLNEETATRIFNEILAIQLEDNATFELTAVNPIREDDEYGWYCLSINAKFETLNVQLKIDLTSGDKITPREVKYSFNLLFSDKSIEVLAYNLETVIAEKYETIIRRSVANTRIRDFYDIYILMNFQKQNIDFDVLKTAIAKTAEHRGSSHLLADADETINLIEDDKDMQTLWGAYQAKFEYAKDITWQELMDALKII